MPYKIFVVPHPRTGEFKFFVESQYEECQQYVDKLEKEVGAPVGWFTYVLK